MKVEELREGARSTVDNRGLVRVKYSTFIRLLDVVEAAEVATGRCDAIADVSDDETPEGNVKMSDRDSVLWICEHLRDALRALEADE